MQSGSKTASSSMGMSSPPPPPPPLLTPLCKWQRLLTKYFEVIKTRRMKWAGHVVHDSKQSYTFLLQNLSRKGHLRTVDISVRQFIKMALTEKG